MKRLLLVVSALLLLVVASGCGAGGVGQPAAATVDGRVITRQSLYEDLDALASSTSLREQVQIYGENEGSYSTSFVNQVLSARIVDALVRNELEARGGTIAPEDLQQADTEYTEGFGPAVNELPESFRTRQVETLAARNALSRLLAAEGAGDEPIPEEEIRAYYDENIDRIMEQAGGEVPCVSHIMVAFDPQTLSATEPTPEQDQAARAEADALLARIRGGEEFGAVATAESDDPASAANNGDLGCQPGSSQIGEAFDQAMLSQPLGEVGEPVRTDFGYHLILVRSRGVVPYEEVRGQIEQVLIDQRQQQSESPIGAWLNQAVLDAEVEVDPLFGSFEPQQFLSAGLVPPEGPMQPQGTVPALAPPS